MKKILITVAIITTIITINRIENFHTEKKFNMKKEKALKVVNAEIEKRNNLNKKMEKLARDFGANYENNLNDNLLKVREKIEKAKNEKELMDIINN